MNRFEVFQQANDRWSWVLRGRNGHLICVSVPDYKDASAAKQAARRALTAIQQAALQTILVHDGPDPATDR